MIKNPDVLITGAGAVGLATALSIQEQRPDWSVVVVEKAGRVAATASLAIGGKVSELVLQE